MRIWIDLTNSPHVQFFKPFVKVWQQEKHEIIITSRDLANTIQLIENEGWEHSEVGGHAGKNKIKKLLYFPKRCFQLYNYLKTRDIDISISHSSFYSPVVSHYLGVPSIYINDNEHANGNHLAMKYATLNLFPEALETLMVKSGLTKRYSINFYPGIKEAIYLHKFDADAKHLKSETIYIRLEPATAEYYSGNSNTLDDLITQLDENFQVVILPRSKEQASYYSNLNLNNLKVQEFPLELKNIAASCRLFIGAGGSMTRELAFLGVPTISVYQDELLEVDKYLVKNGYMSHQRTPTMESVMNYLSRYESNSSMILKEKGKKAFSLILYKVKEQSKCSGLEN